jgi:hypothetical protein
MLVVRAPAQDRADVAAVESPTPSAPTDEPGDLTAAGQALPPRRRESGAVATPETWTPLRDRRQLPPVDWQTLDRQIREAYDNELPPAESPRSAFPSPLGTVAACTYTIVVLLVLALLVSPE